MASLAGWYRVEFFFYVAGFRVDEEGIIREAPPIMGWAIGTHVQAYAKWARNKRPGHARFSRMTQGRVEQGTGVAS